MGGEESVLNWQRLVVLCVQYRPFIHLRPIITLLRWGNKTGSMALMKTMIAIHDFSCHSKSSLTVVLPALSALGIDYSVLPTALLSTQTDGFEGYAYFDLTQFMRETLAHWGKLNLKTDSLYSGFLGSEEQIEVVQAVIKWQKEKSDNFLVIVDPVLGDKGEPYGPVTQALIDKMGNLVKNATVITPNITEAALLLGEDYQETLNIEEGLEWAKRLSQMGPSKVAITSIMEERDGVVVAYDAANGGSSIAKEHYLPISYPGCGDLFASILAAQMVEGMAFLEATKNASKLVSKAVSLAYEAGRERNLGISVELIIPDLVESRQ